MPSISRSHNGIGKSIDQHPKERVLECTNAYQTQHGMIDAAEILSLLDRWRASGIPPQVVLDYRVARASGANGLPGRKPPMRRPSIATRAC